MLNYLKERPGVALGTGLVVGLLVGAGMLVPSLVAVSHFLPDKTSSDDSPFPNPENILHASSAYGGKQMAMATGVIDESVEGLFVLDFLTGDLYCWILNPRAITSGKYVGQFKRNVVKDLGLAKGKQPDYILVTGGISTLRGRGAAKPADCVCYVGDGSTGNVAAYSLPYNRSMANAGQIQEGNLVLLAKSKARPLNAERAQ